MFVKCASPPCSGKPDVQSLFPLEPYGSRAKAGTAYAGILNIYGLISDSGFDRPAFCNQPLDLRQSRSSL